MRGEVYTPDKQGRSVMDDGRIIELRPIALSGEGGAVTRVGPLFYWSWLGVPLEGHAPMHRHQGFEVVTYMIQGKTVHQDEYSGHKEAVAGDLLLMRSGSGIQHEEWYTGPDAEGFQIWLEPHLRNALKQNPACRQYISDQLPVLPFDGGSRKIIIGDGSPVDVSVDVHMIDLQVLAGHKAAYELKPGRMLAALAVRGGGVWYRDSENDGSMLPFLHRDFMVIEHGSEGPEGWSLLASDDIRMILIDVPRDPGYPLYAKRP
ncbi:MULTISPECIES: pirin family protein [Paenibacillus]|uniref:Pirin n=1 Tax=Paenibacillus campinasensis TaxID=66347 RepID=A0A268EQX1_9BACL|nr:MULTISPECIES: pirin family protein [Paenibacillus]MUG65486.1 pirin [Paenibacillus campinasensis]PAD75491.1 pirin [Paenibacillus campinasensis]PAK51477.1 pirin [Paenibacillus sp. 7541]